MATSSATSVPVNGSVAALASCVPCTCVVVRASFAGATSGGFGGFGYAPAALNGASAPSAPTAETAAMRTILERVDMWSSTVSARVGRDDRLHPGGILGTERPGTADTRPSGTVTPMTIVISGEIRIDPDDFDTAMGLVEPL